MSDPNGARDRLIRTERVKLTATDLNTATGGLFTAGVVPVAAAVFGVTGIRIAYRPVDTSCRTS